MTDKGDSEGDFIWLVICILLGFTALFVLFSSWLFTPPKL